MADNNDNNNEASETKLPGPNDKFIQLQEGAVAIVLYTDTEDGEEGLSMAVFDNTDKSEENILATIAKGLVYITVNDPEIVMAASQAAPDYPTSEPESEGDNVVDWANHTKGNA